MYVVAVASGENGYRFLDTALGIARVASAGLMELHIKKTSHI